jgi:hypothetical protein
VGLLQIQVGSTGQFLPISAQDSSLTTGDGLPGLEFDTPGLECSYDRPDTGSVPVALADMTLGVWASGGFKEVDAADQPGDYHLGIPNAALVPGARWVRVHLRGAADMAPVILLVELVTEDLAAVAGRLPAALVGGRMDASVGAMANDVVTAAAIAADAIGASELAAGAVTEIQAGLSTLDAAGVRAAVGLAAANLDAQLDALPTANEGAAALLDLANGVATGRTVRQILRGLASALLGLSSGNVPGEAGELLFRDVNDTKDAIAATVDESGNRTAIVLDLT